jgi:hydroxymethylbilane synthase
MRPDMDEPRSDQEVILATSSPRRHALLQYLYPKAKIIPLRGNVDTRLRKLHEGEFDGMVLSYAGLERLEAQEHVTKIYDPREMLPAVGQGVLCIQVRKEDAARCAYLRTINSEVTEKIVAAERAMLMHLQGDCYSAIAGYCKMTAGVLSMQGLVASSDGKTILKADATQDITHPPEELGMLIAHQLLQQGARELIDLHG